MGWPRPIAPSPTCIRQWLSTLIHEGNMKDGVGGILPADNDFNNTVSISSFEYLSLIRLCKAYYPRMIYLIIVHGKGVFTYLHPAVVWKARSCKSTLWWRGCYFHYKWRLSPDAMQVISLSLHFYQVLHHRYLCYHCLKEVVETEQRSTWRGSVICTFRETEG